MRKNLFGSLSHDVRQPSFNPPPKGYVIDTSTGKPLSLPETEVPQPKAIDCTIARQIEQGVDLAKSTYRTPSSLEDVNVQLADYYNRLDLDAAASVPDVPVSSSVPAPAPTDPNENINA